MVHISWNSFWIICGKCKNPEHIKCLVAYYSFGDFKTLMIMLNNSELDEQAEKFSLVDLLSKKPDKIPPIFIARAGMDDPLPNESLDKFITKALANNLYVDVYNHPTGHHAFDLFDDNKRTHDIKKRLWIFYRAFYYRSSKSISRIFISKISATNHLITNHLIIPC